MLDRVIADIAVPNLDPVVVIKFDRFVFVLGNHPDEFGGHVFELRADPACDVLLERIEFLVHAIQVV